MLIVHLNIAIMRIRVKNGIVAKQQPENLVVVEFTPLVAGEYDAQLIDHEFVEITKPNGKPRDKASSKLWGSSKPRRVLK